MPRSVEGNGDWPDIQVAKWAGTKRSLHLYLQMLGKIRVALSPTQPNWMFTALFLTPRGVTTGFVPYEQSSFEARLDAFDSRIVVERSDGRTGNLDLLPARTVADVYEALTSVLRRLDIGCYISPIPQEVPDTTPFDTDTGASEYDAAAVLRWFHAMTATAVVFERWKSCFFGRSGIQLWWGALDLSLMLFSGRHVAPPADRGYLMKYDLDAEMMNVGLYAGDEKNPPFFYGYLYPEPRNAHALPVRPPASWSSALHEWTMPYEDVRKSPDPSSVIRAFIDDVYEQCFASAGWDRDACGYATPKRSPSSAGATRTSRPPT